MEGGTVEPKNSTFLNGNGFRRLEQVEPRRKYIRGVTIVVDPAASCREEIAAKLKVNYADVFRTGLGRCTKAKATLQLKSDAYPMYLQKKAPVPFAYVATLDEEIDIDSTVCLQNKCFLRLTTLLGQPRSSSSIIKWNTTTLC
uniref:Uncharacterized protein n=1 Tax=Haemonchus contortus TaxID=6289 RepID=A0A7I5E7V9_HAECO